MRKRCKETEEMTTCKGMNHSGIVLDKAFDTPPPPPSSGFVIPLPLGRLLTVIICEWKSIICGY